MRGHRTGRRVVFISLPVLVLTGCGGGDDAETSPQTGENRAPVIAGQPPASVSVGEAYSFTPTASDADGDPLQFTAGNLPSWAQISASTGAISGTPAAANVGTHAGITITVSDSRASAQLGPFSIAVLAVGSGSATLSWVPPTQNSDGSALTNLANYRIRYGRSAANLDQSVTVSAATSTHVIENLSPGDWYFFITAVNARGDESAPSNLAFKSIG